MDIFLKYFTPAICILIFSVLPIYFMRIINFIRKSYFIDETLSLNLSLYIHLFVYAVFIINLFFYTPIISELVLYIFAFAMIALLIILIGYRQRFENIKRNRFVVLFSKWDNRKAFQKYLDDKGYSHIDILDGSFSYVTRIKFNNAKIEEIDQVFDELKTSGLLHSFTSLKGYLLFALNTALFFGSILAFVVFFAFIPRLG